MLKNKIILISFLLIIILLFFNSDVFATTNKYYHENYQNNDIVTMVPEDVLDKFYASEQYNSGDYYLMVTKNDITTYKVYLFPKTELDKSKIYCDGSKFYFNPVVSGVLVYKATSDGIGSLIGRYNFTKEIYMHTSANLFYSDFNVYSDNSYTSFFFLQRGIVADKLRGMKMEPLMEIVKLVPLIIVLMVSFLGFRKGLQVLSSILHKA